LLELRSTGLIVMAGRRICAVSGVDCAIWTIEEPKSTPNSYTPELSAEDRRVMEAVADFNAKGIEPTASEIAERIGRAPPADMKRVYVEGRGLVLPPALHLDELDTLKAAGLIAAVGSRICPVTGKVLDAWGVVLHAHP
jgi:hypothetical protein